MSGHASQQIDVSEDYFQLIIIDCGDAGVTYALRVIVDFHTPPAPPPAPPEDCATTEAEVRSCVPSQLAWYIVPMHTDTQRSYYDRACHVVTLLNFTQQLCGSSKAASMSACLRCLAEENATLTTANCTAAAGAAFCHGAPPSIPRTCPKLDSPALHATLPTTIVPSSATFLWANATCDDGYHINDGSIHFYCANFPPRQMCMVDGSGNAQWEAFQCPCMKR